MGGVNSWAVATDSPFVRGKLCGVNRGWLGDSNRPFIKGGKGAAQGNDHGSPRLDRLYLAVGGPM